MRIIVLFVALIKQLIGLVTINPAASFVRTTSAIMALVVRTSSVVNRYDIYSQHY